MIRIAIIGYGYWGPNLVRNFNKLDAFKVAGVGDIDLYRSGLVATQYRDLATTTDIPSLLFDPSIDAVAITTPVSTHYELALQALEANKHVLIAKPIAANSEQAMRLIEMAEKNNLVLLVDHTFLFTGAVRKIHELVSAGDIGSFNYYDSVRINLGLFQHDIDVLWDLAVHDLSILDYVLDLQPVAVSATGINHLPDQPDNIAYLTLFFDERTIAHVHVNWLAPVKLRRTLIGGSRKMIIYNDLEPGEKVKVYDYGLAPNDDQQSRHKMLIEYQTGDMWAPKVDNTEALKTEALHFAECIENGVPPISDGMMGWRIVRILEAASRSLRMRGAPVEISYEADSP